jgi:phospholipid/cholesterol/gamma-HCH transport system substrate-binding protein
MRRRLQGLLFVVVLLALSGLAVGEYAGAFDDGVPVTLRVDRVGTQLAERADVKIRGLDVGEVESISTDGDGVTVELSLDPEQVDRIPADVSARLIPKTLFGERYVSLVPPERPRAVSLAAGDVIPMDRSESARELERVLDGLLPLLTAVEPQELSNTLGSLSQALQGRGADLGETLVRLQELTGGLRPAIPDLQEDITQLADFAGNLDAAAPDLLDALEDFTVTSRTVVEQRTELRELLTSVTGTSDDLRAFLDANGDNLIGLADSARPTLETLARYAPEYPCLFDQIAGLVPRIDDAFGVGTDRPGLRITLEIVANQGKYVPNQDEPEYLDDRGPRCYPILDPGPEQPPGGPFEDGTKPNSNPSIGTVYGDPEELGVVPTSHGTTSHGTTSHGTTSHGTGPAEMGVPNSPGERRIVAELFAVQQGTAPEAAPAWSSMLVGPLYRGTEVTLT